MVDPPLPASILTTHMVQAFQAGLHSPLRKFSDVRIVVREESESYRNRLDEKEKLDNPNEEKERYNGSIVNQGIVCLN